MGATIWTTYPGKAIWTLFAVVINTIRFPLWIVYYIPSGTRPHPKWTYLQCIGVQIVKNFLWNAAAVEMKTPLSLKPGWEGDRWHVAQPPSAKYFVGPTVIDPEIKPVPTGATWYPKKPSPTSKPGLVILHYHGGAYMIGDGRTHDAGFAARTLLKNTDASHVYAPQYRLACNPLSRFPAALQDAITTYTYLVDKEGVDPRQIVLSGDSAGANLVLALLRYIADHGDEVGLVAPRAALLWSPWLAPNKSLTTEAFDTAPNRPTDYITGEFGSWGAFSYMPAKATGLDLDSPYISFGGQPFATKTPLYFSGGECEVLFQDIAEAAQQFTAVKGNTVEFQIEELAVHDIILTGHLVGFWAEAGRAAKRAGVWLRSVAAN